MPPKTARGTNESDPNSTERLIKLCRSFDWHPPVDAVIPLVSDGADLFHSTSVVLEVYGTTLTKEEDEKQNNAAHQHHDNQRDYPPASHRRPRTWIRPENRSAGQQQEEEKTLDNDENRTEVFEGPLLLLLCYIGNVEVVKACLEHTPFPMDFTRTPARNEYELDADNGADNHHRNDNDDVDSNHAEHGAAGSTTRRGLTALHCAVLERLRDEQTRGLLDAIVHRVQTHPTDRIDWMQENVYHQTMLDYAAEYHKLAVVWRAVEMMPVFADRTRPLPLPAVWQDEWEDLNHRAAEKVSFSHPHCLALPPEEDDMVLMADRPTARLWKLSFFWDRRIEEVLECLAEGANPMFEVGASILEQFVLAEDLAAVRACLVHSRHRIPLVHIPSVEFSMNPTIDHDDEHDFYDVHESVCVVLDQWSENTKKNKNQQQGSAEEPSAAIVRLFLQYLFSPTFQACCAFTPEDHTTEKTTSSAKVQKQASNALLTAAAERGKLFVTWEMIKTMGDALPYFADMIKQAKHASRPPIELLSTIHQSDWMQLSEEDQALFLLLNDPFEEDDDRRYVDTSSMSDDDDDHDDNEWW